MILCLFFFFFKQRTAYEMRISDWSSDVCSSDLPDAAQMFLDDGTWPKAGGWAAAAGQRIALPRAADTLAYLAEQGPRAFYDGDIGAGLEIGGASWRERGCQYG